ncbi:1-deoxy-D-xylulose-5-phosphate synthase [Pleomorphomonas oryzae]|uniref:1-deoxy-D-xylulose-5-phosphate synthase n=1 Tax=Pleomorphomonas oryzae TaxID=261934 RepID=UPI001FE0BEBB|nr:1-deoxy-D-xylulose-5-phosphate synthase [Pleomorphomonas oryzae]
MYIEDKSAGLNGPARIGRVTFSKTGRSVSYGGRTFLRSTQGFKANYVDIDNGERFWISGPRQDGKDRLYPSSSQPIEIDEDVAEEYWRDIRKTNPPG